jgi:RsiW-degrading membrane proteinase PrsW (M82 family)
VAVSTQALPPTTRRRRISLLRLFLTGLALWVATVVVTYTTQNVHLVPTVILLGSFLVPTTFVVWVFRREHEVVTTEDVLTGMVVGGVLGVLGASILESQFLRPTSLFVFVGVGFIEEFVKLAALWIIALRLPRYTARDGAVLGAAVGFGFAALESAGYAFNAMFTVQGLDLRALVETEVLRSVLSPFGHGLWTAILGMVLFRTASRTGHLHPTLGLIGWYVVVSLLHAFWDMSSGLAALITWILTHQVWQEQLLNAGRIPVPTTEQAHIYTITNWVLLGLDAVVGVFLLHRLHRRLTPPHSHRAGPDRPRPVPA